jgi:hypothetical protein
VLFRSLEVCNGPRGISLGECTYVTVRNCSAHDVQSRALGGSGDHLTFEGNKVWNACLMNENNGQISRGQRGGWPAAVQTWKRDDHSATTNVVFRNNEVRECWGEGIDAFFCDGGVIEGNTVRDCYSVLIYNDTARNIRMDRNYLYISTDKFDRSDTKHSATGILISMEKYDFQVPPITDEDYVISNNLIVGTGSGISYWHDAGNTKPVNSYRSITVCHNVVKDTKGDALRFDAVPAANNAPAGCVARNNIFFKGSSGGALSLGNAAAWTLSHNCWPNGVPAGAKEPNSFAADPQFLKPAGGGPEGLKLSPTSPCLGKAMPVENATADFWGTPRRKTQPCIGLHEWMPPGSEPEKTGKASPRKPAIP